MTIAQFTKDYYICRQISCRNRLCISSLPCRGLGGIIDCHDACSWQRHNVRKSVIGAWFLTVWNFATFKSIRTMQRWCSWVCNIRAFRDGMHCVYIHTAWGLVARSIDRAMRRPHTVERATMWLHASVSLHCGTVSVSTSFLKSWGT